MGSPEQTIGQLLGGKYRIHELLALGGMGLVYGARHEATGRAVAVKLMRPELAGRPDFVRRVSIEARLAVEASHPNVVEVLDAGTHGFDVPYLVLERLYGQPLDALIDEPLPLLAATQALMPVINALTVLHRLGIVHRDIKPSNIFLSDGAEGRVTPKLLDFGIAKALESAGATLPSTALGTPAYMAPEQALGCTSGPFTDVWSIGVVFVRCLTGRLPFEGMASRGIGNLRSGLRAADLRDVPEPLARVLARALQLDPGERPASMAAFRGDLSEALREIDSAQAWPDETTVSYARHECALASALSELGGTPKGDMNTGEPQTPRARVRVRSAQTSTLSKLRTAGLRGKKLSPRLLLTLSVMAALAWGLGWSRRDVASAAPDAAPAQVVDVEAPRAASEVAASPRASDASNSNTEASTAISALSMPPGSSHVGIAAGGAPPRRPTPPPDRAAGTKPRETEAHPSREMRASPEVPEVNGVAGEVPPTVGANRSPIIEWNAQN